MLADFLLMSAAARAADVNIQFARQRCPSCFDLLVIQQAIVDQAGQPGMERVS